MFGFTLKFVLACLIGAVHAQKTSREDASQLGQSDSSGFKQKEVHADHLVEVEKQKHPRFLSSLSNASLTNKKDGACTYRATCPDISCSRRCLYMDLPRGWYDYGSCCGSTTYHWVVVAGFCSVGYCDNALKPCTPPTTTSTTTTTTSTTTTTTSTTTTTIDAIKCLLAKAAVTRVQADVEQAQEELTEAEKHVESSCLPEWLTTTTTTSSSGIILPQVSKESKTSHRRRPSSNHRRRRSSLHRPSHRECLLAKSIATVAQANLLQEQQNLAEAEDQEELACGSEGLTGMATSNEPILQRVSLLSLSIGGAAGLLITLFSMKLNSFQLPSSARTPLLQ